MYKRILLPLDGSAQAMQAMPHAIAQAERFGAELVLLAVLVPARGVHGLESDSHQWVRNYQAALARRNLEDAAADARQRNIPVTVSTAEGHPPAAILEFVEENEVDLVVMSTRGHSGLSRWLLGSVAGRVVRDATAAVILVRVGNGDRQEGKDGE